MNDRELDALLEKMKQRGTVAREGERSADELLAAVKARSVVSHSSAAKAAIAAMLLLASLGYCFHAYSVWQSRKATESARMAGQEKNKSVMNDVAAEAIAEAAVSSLIAEKQLGRIEVEVRPAKAAKVGHMIISSSREKWRFLPCFGNDVRGVEVPHLGDGHFHDTIPPAAEKLLSEGKLTEEQRTEFYWHSVAFPHRDFTRIMPMKNAFGWYGCEFDVPNALQGMDVYADLGVIDDADETLVNGAKVGGTGMLAKGSAWQEDRLYRIPAARLTPFGNYMAVHVWNLSGFGGIIGPPVLKAALVPPDAQWEIAFICGKTLVGRLNSADSLEKAMSLLSVGTDLQWRKALMPWRGWKAWGENDHYAVFRTSFSLMNGDSSRRMDTPVVVDCGPVFDVAAFYLNGRRIGIVGRFPEGDSPAFTEAAQRARLIVQPDAWAVDGTNELVAVVFRERGVGGLPGVPGLLLHNPLADSNDASVVHDLYNIYIQSANMPMAERILSDAKPNDNRGKVTILSDKAHLAFLRWLDGGQSDTALLDGVLVPIAEIFRTLPNEAPMQSAMQAFCRVLQIAENNNALMATVRHHFPRFGKSINPLPPDRLTLGDWPLAYGENSYLLPWIIRLPNQNVAIGAPAEFKLMRADGNHYLLWNKGEVATRLAMLNPSSNYQEWQSSAWLDGCLEYGGSPTANGGLFAGKKMRQFAWWNDGGVSHPFDDAGPNLRIDVSQLAQGALISICLGDLDWRNSLHPRQQSIVALDENGELLTAIWSGKSDTGVYERFLMTDTISPRFLVLKHRSPCVAVTGLFCDMQPVITSEALASAERLSPSAADAFRLAIAAESQNRIPFAAQDYAKCLAKIDSAKDFEALLVAFSNIQGLHPVWQCMALARLRPLLKEMNANDARNILERLAKTTNGSRIVPWTAIVEDMPLLKE